MTALRRMLLTLAALLATAAPAHADLRTRGWISALAMQGPRVAVGAQAAPGVCTRALLWNAVAGGVVRLSAPGPSATCPRERPGGIVRPVALAGGRAAWIVTQSSNTEQETSLVTAALAAPGHEARAAHALANPESGSGAYLGDLVGGPRLLFDAWSQTAGSVASASLRRLSGTSTSTLASGPGVLHLAASDGVRSAVLRADGSAALLGADGAAQRVITPGATVRAVALAGGTLMLQVTGSRVLAYDAASGALQRTLSLAPGSAAGIDLQGGRLVYRTFRAVRVLRVSDRRDAVVATATRAVIDAQIEDGGGLVYAVNTFAAGAEVGLVHHLSFAQVDARLG